MKSTNIQCDVMVNGKFYLQFTYKHPSIFVLNLNDVYKYAREKFTSLRNKDFKIEFGADRICKRK